jgi:hypothetical protein
MTLWQEVFIETLNDEDYSYKVSGNKIVVTDVGSVDLRALTSLPPGVKFSNGGDVNLEKLTSLPTGVEFKNEGDVQLSSLISLPSGVVFNNEDNVLLNDLTSISPGVEFNNGGNVYLRALIGGRFSKWKGNIPGIAPNRLLNSMINKGLFER